MLTSAAPAQKTCPPKNELLKVVDAKGRIGFIDRRGRVVIHPTQLPERTVVAHDFSDGLAAIAVNPKGNELAGFTSGVTKYGFIDTTGRWVIEPQFDYAYQFCDGLAWVEKGGVQIYIDRTGRVAIDTSRDCQKNDFYGKKLGRCPERLLANNRFVGQYSEGLIAVSDGKHGRQARYGFMDIRGREVIGPRFEPELEHHGFIRYLSRFSEGFAKVKIGGRYGFINKRGKLVIKARFTTASDFSDGLAFVTEGDKAGYINQSGRWAVTLKTPASGNSFSGGLAAVAIRSSSRVVLGRDYVWGYIDKQGRIVIQPRFDAASEFINGVAKIYELLPNLPNWESQFGYIDRKARYIWRPGSTFEEVAAKQAATVSLR